MPGWRDTIADHSTHRPRVPPFAGPRRNGARECPRAITVKRLNRRAARSIRMAVLLVGPGLEGLEAEIALESFRYRDAPLVPRLGEVLVLIGVIEADRAGVGQRARKISPLWMRPSRGVMSFTLSLNWHMRRRNWIEQS